MNKKFFSIIGTTFMCCVIISTFILLLVLVTRDNEKEVNDVMTLNEAASYMRITEGKLVEILEYYSPSIPHIKIDNEYRIWKQAIDNWMCNSGFSKIE